MIELLPRGQVWYARGIKLVPTFRLCLYLDMRNKENICSRLQLILVGATIIGRDEPQIEALLPQLESSPRKRAFLQRLAAAGQIQEMTEGASAANPDLPAHARHEQDDPEEDDDFEYKVRRFA